VRKKDIEVPDSDAIRESPLDLGAVGAEDLRGLRLAMSGMRILMLIRGGNVITIIIILLGGTPAGTIRCLRSDGKGSGDGGYALGINVHDNG
jgi:hypothetical protein